MRALSAQMKNNCEKEEVVSNTLMKSMKRQNLNFENPYDNYNQSFRKGDDLERTCNALLPPLILKKRMSSMHYHKNFTILNKKYAILQAKAILSIVGRYLIQRVEK